MSYFLKNDFVKIYSTVNEWFKNHELKPIVTTLDGAFLEKLVNKYNGKYIVNIANTSAGGDKSLFEASFLIQIMTQKTTQTGLNEFNIVEASSQGLTDLTNIYGLIDDFVTQCELQNFEINIVNHSDYDRLASPDWEIIESTFTFSIMNQGRK